MPDLETSKRLTVPARFAEVRRICDFMAAGAAEAGFDEETVFHIDLCCDEASTNIIEHAYGQEGAGEIRASYDVVDDTFRIILQDDGRHFDPSTIPPPPIINEAHKTPEEVANQIRVGGLGWHFIRNLMDEVYFTSDRQSGNTLVMLKKRVREEKT